jgi:hypothetical protein
MPCDPNSININIPDGPSGPSIPGFGVPFAYNLPRVDVNFEVPDLEGLFNLIKFLLPIGDLQGALNPNFGKDIIDSIIKVLDMFLPFLMLYKFFLPILKLILCILEVVCALPNPVKVIKAVQKLFRECIPLFLSLFPILALLIMILAILLLIIQLIIYIVLLILQLAALLIENIVALVLAIERADAESILAIAAKIGRILCLFQNVFVVFLMIALIVQIFKDILSMAFAIPPCDSGDNSSFQNCCTSDVCPNFIRYSNFIRTTGSLQYISGAQNAPDLSALFPAGTDLTVLKAALTRSIRIESFQFYDDASAAPPPGKYTTENFDPGPGAYVYQQFINMIDAKDVESTPKPVFFPSDAVYSSTTPPSQAPYTVDIKVFYDPLAWGRSVAESGPARYVTFKDCIVTTAASPFLINPDGTFALKSTGVLSVAGGKGTEENGDVIIGYDKSVLNNTTRLSNDPKNQATIENFFFLYNPVAATGVPSSIPGIDVVTLNNIEYTFKINQSVLLSKNLITYGCTPEVANDRTFTNAVFSNDVNVKIAELKNFTFPDLTKAQECVFTAIDVFRNNVTVDGAETLQNTAVACMEQLRKETEDAISKIIPIAFDQYKSTFSVEPAIQFTSKPIKVKVDLKESSGAELSRALPSQSSFILADKITPTITFGDITKFTYDGSQYFTAEITSKVAGSGTIDIAFDNKKISDVNIPANLTQPSSVSIRRLNYEFIYAPASTLGSVSVGIGDTSDGQAPRRDEGDVSRSETGSRGE